MILDFSNGQSVDNVLLNFGTTTSSLYTDICNVGNCFATPTPFSITFGKWTHIAVTFTTNNNLITYINGQQVSSFNSNLICRKVLRASCKVGRSSWYPTDGDLNAVLDELKIFNRSLSAAEVLNEMQLLEPFGNYFFD